MYYLLTPSLDTAQKTNIKVARALQNKTNELFNTYLGNSIAHARLGFDVLGRG
jgi:hypothetical protein